MSKLNDGFKLRIEHIPSFFIALLFTYIDSLVINENVFGRYLVIFLFSAIIFTFLVERFIYFFNKINKRTWISSVVFSVLLSFGFIIGKIYKYSYADYTRQILNFDPIYILYFVILCFQILIFTINLYFISEKYPLNLKDKDKKILWFIVPLIVILICYLPYLLAFCPANMSNDSTTSIRQVIGTEIWNNHHPITFTFVVGIFIWLGKLFSSDLTVGIYLFSIAQTIFLASVLSYIIYWLSKKKINSFLLVLSTIFFAVFPVFPMYGMSVWKDIIFSCLLSLFSLMLFDIVLSKGKYLKKTFNDIKFVVLGLLVTLFRNNGIYIVFAISIVLIIVFRKYIKRFLISCISIVVLYVIITNPILNLFNIEKGEFSEALGVPLQQIALTFKENGNVSNEEKEYIDKLIRVDTLTQIYDPFEADMIYHSSAFNQEFLEDNKVEFFKNYLTIGVKNIPIYLKAWLRETFGYYSVQSSCWIYFFGPFDTDILNIKNPEILDKIFGVGSINRLTSLLFKHAYGMNPAIGFWIFMLSVFFMIMKKKTKFIIANLPSLFLFLTLMIAAPIAMEFRFMFVFYILLPVNIISLFIKGDNIIEDENKDILDDYSELELKLSKNSENE